MADRISLHQQVHSTRPDIQLGSAPAGDDPRIIRSVRPGAVPVPRCRAVQARTSGARAWHACPTIGPPRVGATDPVPPRAPGGGPDFDDPILSSAAALPPLTAEQLPPSSGGWFPIALPTSRQAARRPPAPRGGGRVQVSHSSSHSIISHHHLPHQLTRRVRYRPMEAGQWAVVRLMRWRGSGCM